MAFYDDMEEESRFTTGAKISVAAHVLFVFLVIFWGPLFDHRDEAALQVSGVSILTEAEFAELAASEPAPQPEETVEEPAVVAAEPVETAPSAEEPAAVAEAAEPPAIEPEPAPEIVAEPEAIPEPAVVPEPAQAPEVVAEPEEIPTPEPADRITDEINPEPAPEAIVAEDLQEEVAVDETATEVAPAEEATAPEESTTQIVTEADPPSENAPEQSDRPALRPANLMKQVEAARLAAEQAEQAAEAQAQAEREAAEEAARQAEAEAAAEAERAAEAAEAAEAEAARQAAEQEAAEEAARIAAQEAEASAIEAALQAAMANQAALQLTSGEVNSLMLQVQSCWNVPVGVIGAENLVVVLRANLNEDGHLRSTPTLVEPSGSLQGAQQQAFEAARRALIECAPYDLPREKYDAWRDLDVVFNPANMVRN